MKRILPVLACALLAQAPLAAAGVDDAEVQALREQIRQLSRRLDQLEREARVKGADSEGVTDATTANDKTGNGAEARSPETVDTVIRERLAGLSWAERMKLSGDFRYRFENTGTDGQPDRNRSRIRARVGLQARVTDTVRAGFGLASGGQDPVSSNQTLGSAGSSKDVTLDLAYAEWNGIADTTVLAGKYKNPLRLPAGSQLIWDSDWRPEGLAFHYDGGTVFASGIATWLESDSKKQQEFSFGAQAGVRVPLASGAEWQVGGGYYEIDTAGKATFFGDGDFFGNSFDAATGTYLYDYHLVEGFTTVSLNLLHQPLELFGHYVHNLDADGNDSGYAVGFGFGEARARGTWAFGYTYKRVEADAVLGLLTHSDFGGGGSDAKGSIFQGVYAIDDNWNFEATYFANRIHLQSGQPLDFDRLQLDLKFKY